LSNCSDINSLALSSSFHSSLVQRTPVMSVVTSMVEYTPFSTDSLQIPILPSSLFWTTDISSPFSAQNFL